MLPPEDFGKEPTISRPKKGEGRKKLDTLKKESRTNVINNGFVDGNPSYSFQIYLKPGEQYIAKLDVQTSSKKYTFDDWDKYNFVLPCYFKKLIIDEFQIDKVTYHQIIRRDFENNERNIIKSNGLGVKQFQILVFETPITNKVCGFKLTNNSSDEDLRITINVILQSVDETTGFSISRSLTRMGGDNNG